MLRLWGKHFSTLIYDDDDTNTAFRNVVPDPIDDDSVEISPPCLEEVKIAITSVKSSKAAGPDGLRAELFKTGCNGLVEFMHQLIYKIWLQEIIPNNWNRSVLCLVLKKGDPTLFVTWQVHHRQVQSRTSVTLNHALRRTYSRRNTVPLYFPECFYIDIVSPFLKFLQHDLK